MRKNEIILLVILAVLIEAIKEQQGQMTTQQDQITALARENTELKAIMADQMQAYTLSDRGTYLTFKDRIELVDLEITGDELRNPYGLLKVNPEKSNMVNGELADLLCDFLIAPETQMMIRDFKIDGESLFHPLRLPEQQ